MSIFSKEFLDWFQGLKHKDMTQTELAWKAWREGQDRLTKRIIPELVEATGEVGMFRETTLKATERLAIQLSSIVEQVQYHGKS